MQVFEYWVKPVGRDIRPVVASSLQEALSHFNGLEIESAFCSVSRDILRQHNQQSMAS